VRGSPDRWTSRAGLEIFASIGEDHGNYAAKHIRAVSLYCDGRCDKCEKCDEIPKADGAYFSCFDCVRYPPAYGGATCNDLGDETIAGVHATIICGAHDDSTPLIGLVDPDSVYRSQMNGFYNFELNESVGDPMGRYRTKENAKGRGRVRFQSCFGASARLDRMCSACATRRTLCHA